jgi:hypothetical protein
MPVPPGALAAPPGGAVIPPAAGAASGAGVGEGGADGGADSGGLPAPAPEPLPAPPVPVLPASLQPVSATKASMAMVRSSRLVALANQEGKSTGRDMGAVKRAALCGE